MHERRVARDARRAREFETFVAGAGGRLLHAATLLTAEPAHRNPRARRLLTTVLARTYATWDGLRGEDPYERARQQLAVRFARGAWHQHRGHSHWYALWCTRWYDLWDALWSALRDTRREAGTGAATRDARGRAEATGEGSESPGGASSADGPPGGGATGGSAGDGHPGGASTEDGASGDAGSGDGPPGGASSGRGPRGCGTPEGGVPEGRAPEGDVSPVERLRRNARPGGVLDRLSPQERLVLVLRMYEGVAEEQTAALLGLPRERVRAVCERAMSNLLHPPPPRTRPLPKAVPS